MNINKFKILFILLFVTGGVSFAHAFTPMLTHNRCPEDQIIHQNLRAGAYNGRYHPYTRAVVREAHLLQKHLNRLGFSSGLEDGKLGPISTSAIKRMQRSLGTKADGIVGPKTRAVLNNSCDNLLFNQVCCKTGAVVPNPVYSYSLVDIDKCKAPCKIATDGAGNIFETCAVGGSYEIVDMGYCSNQKNDETSDTVAKAELSKWRADIELFSLKNNNNYKEAKPYKTYFETKRGDYKIIFEAKTDSYTAYTQLKSKGVGIFCIDSKGYAGIIKNNQSVYEPGIRCTK